MSGGAFAAKHCLVTSTKQINPKVHRRAPRLRHPAAKATS
jgi:hypothetical protein